MASFISSSDKYGVRHTVRHDVRHGVLYDGVMNDTTRQRILDAATQLVSERGLGALSVRAAAAAGVGATTLRNYFPTQALLHSAVAANFVSFTLGDRRIADAGIPVEQRLAECLEQFLPPQPDPVPALEGWMEYYRLSFGPDAIEGVRELLLAGRRSSAEAVERWLHVVEEEGHSLRGDIPAQATALLALIDGMHLTMLTDPDRLDIPAAQRLLRAFIATSVLTATSVISQN